MRNDKSFLTKCILFTCACMAFVNTLVRSEDVDVDFIFSVCWCSGGLLEKKKWATEMFVRYARTCWANNREKDLFNIMLTLHYCIYFYLFFNVLKMFQENSPKYGGNQTHWWDPRTWPPSYTSERQVHFSLPHRHSDGCIEVFLPHERSWERNV